MLRRLPCWGSLDNAQDRPHGEREGHQDWGSSWSSRLVISYIYCGGEHLANGNFKDLFGFGRRKIEVDPEGSRAVRKVKLKLIRKDMYASILYQVGALKGILDTEGVPLSHIKPHGELFFYMHRDPAIMKAVLRACKPFGVPVYGIENELQTRLCSEMGIEFVHEFYPDIDYDGSGKLVPVYKSKVATVADIHSRILDCGLKDERMSNEGEIIKVGFGHRKFSVCLHSDMPTALENAKAGRRAVDELNSKLGYS